MINYQKWLAAANGIQLTSWEALKAGIVSTTKAMGVWLTTTPAGWATMAVVAIVGVVAAYNALTDSVEETKKKVEDLKSTFQSALDTANSNAKRVEELADRYDELSDGVNNLGENVSLTNEEYEEYNTLVNEIADMFPTLVQGYTDEGNAILNLKGNVEALRDAYKEAQQEAYNLLIADGQDSDGNDIIKQWNDLYDTGFWASAFDLGVDDVGKGISVSDALEQLKAIQNLTAEEYRKIKRIVDSGGSEELSQLSDIELEIGNSSYLKGALGLTWDISDEDFAEAKKQASALVQTYNAQIESALADVRTLANAYLKTNEDYDKLDEQSKNAASIIVNSLDADIASGFEDKIAVGKYVQDIVDTISSNSQVQNAMIDLFTMDTNDMSVGEIKSNVDKYIDIIAQAIGEDSDKLKIRLGFEDIDNLLEKAKKQFTAYEGTNKYNFLASLSETDLEIATKIPDLFADGLDGATAKIEAWKADPNNKITADVDTKSLEDLQKAYDELSKSASNFTKNQKSITSALEEQEKYGQLSASTIQELIEAGFAQALVVDSETGAVTLNKQAYEQLNKEKKQAIILEAKQQKSDLEQKYKDEQSAISDLTLEMKYANEERRKAIILELAQHGQNMAEYADMIDKTNSNISSLDAPTFEDGKEEKPQSVLDFEKEYARRQHEINMGRMKEDEDYYKWLESAAKTAFEGLEDYQDELWKYEEEVYKGRKQLAEDYFDEQQKLFEDRVSNIETQIEITTKTSESSDGTKLNTKEKYDYIRSAYQEIINEIEGRINEIVQTGVDGHEEILAELEKQIEEYQEKLSDVFKSAVEEEQDLIEKQKKAYSDLYDERIDKIKEEKEAAEEAAQAEIDAIQEKIDALEKANKKAEEANDIEEARQRLENAKNQRTRAVIGSDGRMTYEIDQEEVKEAQENLDKLLYEQQINLLEDQKDALEAAKDKQSEAFDTIISDLESEKEAGERRFDVLLKVLDDYLNPDPSTSNVDVWSTLAKQEGVKLDKKGQWVDADGNVIDIEALMKSAETKTDAEKNAGTDSSKDNKDDSKDKTNGKGVEIGRIEKQSFDSENTEDKIDSVVDSFFAKLEKMHNLEQGSLTLEKVMSILTPSMNFNPYGAMNERINKAYSDGYVNNVNNNNNASNVTFSGDININNPVGNANDLANEIVKTFAVKMDKKIHSIRK